MRVIAGSARRLQLNAPDEKVRPTTDRTKETVFNIINQELAGAMVLDLFAGSGSLGIEALSRGSKYCVFSDSYKQSVECIKKNLQHTKLIEKARVFMYDYVKTLDILSKTDDKFDVIFLDPPYNKGLQMEAVKLIHKYDLLSDSGIIIIEGDIKTVIHVEDLQGLSIYKEKDYRTNKFTFVQKERD